MQPPQWLLVMGMRLAYDKRYRRKALLWSAGSGVGIWLLKRYLSSRYKKKRDSKAHDSKALVEGQGGVSVGRRSTRVALNREFWNRLKYLLRILFPRWNCQESVLLAAHSGCLVARTFLSIYIASLDGAIVKRIVAKEPQAFALTLAKWLAIGIPATYINSMIRYLEAKLALAFRSRLSLHLYDSYMKDQVYYKVLNLDDRISNADQCLTEDVSNFCSNLAHLHSQLSKPLLDVVLMSGQLILLARAKAGLGSTRIPIILAGGVVWATYKILKAVAPPFGKMIARQAELEGSLRFVHSRLITNAEEISFYGGHEIESNVLNNAYSALKRHMSYVYGKRILYTMLEGFFMKYTWSAAGMCMIAVPAFTMTPKDPSEDTASGRTESYVTARSLLINAADAIERIMSSYKDVTELAGYVSRVYTMLEVFEDCKQGNYVKQKVSDNPMLNDGQRAEIHIDSMVKLDNVPIVSPNGDILVKSLSFEVSPGMHLLITGPNGCGKSSLFRILGGLWPAMGGNLTRPAEHEMFYIPQRPYLVIGTLKDQVIYPDTPSQMKEKGITESDLEDLLDWVNLRYVVEREGGWDTIREWKDVLSGGEKQRVAMARLFYHKPRFAILDECTSAVSIDVEGKMYEHASEIGISLLTVSHRPSLWKYHNHLLQFDGEGGWSFSELNASARLSLKEEKSKLEAQLAGVPRAAKRLRELAQLLGEESVVLKDF